MIRKKGKNKNFKPVLKLEEENEKQKRNLLILEEVHKEKKYSEKNIYC